MLIETLAWGKLDISEEFIFTFPKGIPGFEDESEFALIAVEGGPFSYLQSLRTESLSFLLADPFVFYPGYEFELPDAEAEELGIQEAVSVRSIITFKEQVELSTINLLAPIVLNPEKRLGKQVVLIKSQYQTKQPLWSGQQTQEGGE
ncbi:flagellar assembly protein FliW ['Paenibacillus yunnanensis' Narsing Rao et al. 2020]|uniref:flagellar assembly protein FliW n=1 Tax=Paenibacillus tengchongensis TaxID=2608684 RepID=UPI00124E370A|nr:flagellar assembly protein FliW [Paenibacillus tengchongensis]